MKADLAIFSHVLGTSGQYQSVDLMSGNKMYFSSCVIWIGFHKSSHILLYIHTVANLRTLDNESV